MKVTFRKAAQADLESVRRWIALDDPDRALSFVQELRNKALGLSEMPLRYPSAGDVGRDDIRKLTHGSYLIYYRETVTIVEILAVRHARREPARFD